MYSTKKELDKFYTKVEVAKSCISSINLSEFSLIIEPSAGGGSFFNNINHSNKIGLDLKPESEGIIEYNWFDFNINPNEEKVLIIGNPPFGKRNKLSIEFIKHACSFENVYSIAFILPEVFKKHTLQKYVPKEFRLKKIIDLDKESFEVDGISYHVPCSFFIFEKSEGIDLRFDASLYKETEDFKYGTKEDYDFFVLGAAPGTTKKIPDSNNRGYFIKVKECKDIEEIENKFKNCKWTGLSSANGGVFWLTKPELIKKYKDFYSL